MWMTIANTTRRSSSLPASCDVLGNVSRDVAGRLTQAAFKDGQFYVAFLARDTRKLGGRRRERKTETESERVRGAGGGGEARARDGPIEGTHVSHLAAAATCSRASVVVRFQSEVPSRRDQRRRRRRRATSVVSSQCTTTRCGRAR